MTNKGFGYNPSQQDLGKVEDVNIPSEYIAHPTNIDEWKDLEKEVSGYDRPEYETAKYSHTIIASTTDFKLKKNVGRKKGNDAKVYATVEKNMERGFRRGKLPPIVLRGDDGKLQEWLVNGNHRWLWYCRNGHAYFLVDVYDKVEGIDDEVYLARADVGSKSGASLASPGSAPLSSAGSSSEAGIIRYLFIHSIQSGSLYNS